MMYLLDAVIMHHTEVYTDAFGGELPVIDLLCEAIRIFYFRK